MSSEGKITRNDLREGSTPFIGSTISGMCSNGKILASDASDGGSIPLIPTKFCPVGDNGSTLPW